jgi:hypothetical protein
MDDNWDFNFDYEHNMDGQWNNSEEIEIYLTTYDGAQHLLLHGWLKKNKVSVKMEHHASKGDGHFGGFSVYISESVLEKLKEDNLENGLFTDLEIISRRTTKTYNMDNITKLDEGIKEFLFDIAGQISSPEDISKFVGQANETTLKLFKQEESYIIEYIETNEMSYKNKIKDLDLLIKYFEEQERYEDCALLVKIKEKVQTRQLLIKIQSDEQ